MRPAGRNHDLYAADGWYESPLTNCAPSDVHFRCCLAISLSIHGAHDVSPSGVRVQTHVHRQSLIIPAVETFRCRHLYSTWSLVIILVWSCRLSAEPPGSQALRPPITFVRRKRNPTAVQDMDAVIAGRLSLGVPLINMSEEHLVAR